MKNKIVDNKLEKLFPPAMRFGGWTAFGIGILLLFLSLISMSLASVGPVIILLLVGGFIAFANNGMQIDPDSKQYKNYTSFMGIKLGSWKSYAHMPYISILGVRESTTAFSRSNRPTTTSDEMFHDIHLLDEKHRQKVAIRRLKDKDQAVKEVKALAKLMDLKYAQYNPVISKSSRAKRR